MKTVNMIEVDNNAVNIYLYEEDIENGWEYIPGMLERYLESVEHDPIDIVYLHYKGRLISSDFAKENDYEFPPDNEGLDYLFQHINNLVLCVNTAGYNADEQLSYKQCIAESKYGTAENIKFADPEWEYPYTI